uniref:Pseudouridine synthase RsuA/RluA-like domain-containing protein n=1 Tax=Bionectria ochroleuca TaxID=29856 RepID=A0A0B7KF09_BIOOC
MEAPKVTVAADPDTSEGKPVQGPSAHAANQVTLSTPIGDMWPRPYIIDDDLRRVAPYHFTYNTWCKERWRNRPLIEIFESEFRDRPLAYYKRAMESGSIYVNGHPVGPDYIIKSRTVRKEYLARVTGMFPDGEVVCDQPILSISPKLGLNRVRANGKSARTVFKRLACMPVTGRTHQLRVHLQYLGHPIQNDPIYANQRVWGFDLGENDADGTGTSDEDVITRLSKMGKEEVAQAVVYYDEMVDDYEKRRAEKMTGELPLPKWALPPKGMSGPTTVGGMDEMVQVVKDENPEIAPAS